MTTGTVEGRAPRIVVGRCFVNPAFDYLLIGGGLSLIFTIVVLMDPRLSSIPLEMVAAVGLLGGSAHFAASTVRLYTKPGSLRAWPLLTMAFPLVMLALLSLAIAFPETAGQNFQSLYLTWSPYHYAAQAYGLAVMYGYRSGCALRDADKRLLRWVSLLPFVYNFTFGSGVGLHWLIPNPWLTAYPSVIAAMNSLLVLLPVLVFTTPVLLYFKIQRSSSGPVPIISMMTVVSNGIWFIVLQPLDAFMWATVFHAVQYLAIVIIFHVREQTALPDNRRSPGQHAVIFYGTSLLLGYGLFQCLPLAYVFAGFGAVESTLMVVAAINIHHFIVDGFIWRFKTGGRNRYVAEGLPAGP